MRKPELDLILTSMLEAYTGISDILFSVGRPLQVEAFGELKEVNLHPDLQALTPHQVEKVALNIIGNNRRLIREYLTMGSCDCSSFSFAFSALWAEFMEQECTLVPYFHSHCPEFSPSGFTAEMTGFLYGDGNTCSPIEVP